MTQFLRVYRQRTGGLIGAALLLAVLMLAGTAGWLYPGSPWNIVDSPFLPPGAGASVLGTDALGRDVAAGIAHGARVTLLLALVSTAAGMVAGLGLGAVAGYYGGKVDLWIVGVIEVFQVIPGFFLAVVLVAILTPSLETVIGAIALVSWPPVARLVRAEFLTLKRREYVAAARLAGLSDARIILTQILPNSLAPIIASGSLMVASAILLESGLSFLGLGDPDSMTWGYLIGTSRTVLRDAWWMSVFPGVAILLSVLAFNLVADALEAALDPARAPAEAAP